MTLAARVTIVFALITCLGTAVSSGDELPTRWELVITPYRQEIQYCEPLLLRFALTNVSDASQVTWRPDNFPLRATIILEMCDSNNSEPVLGTALGNPSVGEIFGRGFVLHPGKSVSGERFLGLFRDYKSDVSDLDTLRSWPLEAGKYRLKLNLLHVTGQRAPLESNWVEINILPVNEVLSAELRNLALELYCRRFFWFEDAFHEEISSESARLVERLTADYPQTVYAELAEAWFLTWSKVPQKNDDGSPSVERSTWLAKLEAFALKYPENPLSDDILFKAVHAQNSGYETDSNVIQDRLRAYQEFLVNYPDSNVRAIAESRIATLEETLLQMED